MAHPQDPRDHLMQELANILCEGCIRAQSLSHVWLFATSWMVACQASLSIGFSRQEYWSGSIPFSRGSSRPRDQTRVSCNAGGFFTGWATRETLLVKGQIVDVRGFADLGCSYSDSAVVVWKQPEVINMQINMWGCVLIKLYLPKKIVDQIWLRGSSLLISHLVELSRWGIQIIFLPLLMIIFLPLLILIIICSPSEVPFSSKLQVFFKVKCHVHCGIYILTI